MVNDIDLTGLHFQIIGKTGKAKKGKILGAITPEIYLVQFEWRKKIVPVKAMTEWSIYDDAEWNRKDPDFLANERQETLRKMDGPT